MSKKNKNLNVEIEEEHFLALQNMIPRGWKARIFQEIITCLVEKMKKEEPEKVHLLLLSLYAGEFDIVPRKRG